MSAKRMCLQENIAARQTIISRITLKDHVLLFSLLLRSTVKSFLGLKKTGFGAGLVSLQSQSLPREGRNRLDADWVS